MFFCPEVFLMLYEITVNEYLVSERGKAEFIPFFGETDIISTFVQSVA